MEKEVEAEDEDRSKEEHSKEERSKEERLIEEIEGSSPQVLRITISN